MGQCQSRQSVDTDAYQACHQYETFGSELGESLNARRSNLDGNYSYIDESNGHSTCYGMNSNYGGDSNATKTPSNSIIVLSAGSGDKDAFEKAIANNMSPSTDSNKTEEDLPNSATPESCSSPDNEDNEPVIIPPIDMFIEQPPTVNSLMSPIASSDHSISACSSPSHVVIYSSRTSAGGDNNVMSVSLVSHPSDEASVSISGSTRNDRSSLGSFLSPRKNAPASPRNDFRRGTSDEALLFHKQSNSSCSARNSPLVGSLSKTETEQEQKHEHKHEHPLGSVEQTTSPGCTTRESPPMPRDRALCTTTSDTATATSPSSQKGSSNSKRAKEDEKVPPSSDSNYSANKQTSPGCTTGEVSRSPLDSYSRSTGSFPDVSPNQLPSLPLEPKSLESSLFRNLSPNRQESAVHRPCQSSQESAVSGSSQSSEKHAIPGTRQSSEECEIPRSLEPSPSKQSVRSQSSPQKPAPNCNDEVSPDPTFHESPPQNKTSSPNSLQRLKCNKIKFPQTTTTKPSAPRSMLQIERASDSISVQSSIQALEQKIQLSSRGSRSPESSPDVHELSKEVHADMYSESKQADSSSPKRAPASPNQQRLVHKTVQASSPNPRSPFSGKGKDSELEPWVNQTVSSETQSTSSNRETSLDFGTVELSSSSIVQQTTSKGENAESVCAESSFQKPDEEKTIEDGSCQSTSPKSSSGNSTSAESSVPLLNNQVVSPLSSNEAEPRKTTEDGSFQSTSPKSLSANSTSAVSSVPPLNHQVLSSPSSNEAKPPSTSPKLVISLEGETAPKLPAQQSSNQETTANGLRESNQQVSSISRSLHASSPKPTSPFREHVTPVKVGSQYSLSPKRGHPSDGEMALQYIQFREPVSPKSASPDSRLLDLLLGSQTPNSVNDDELTIQDFRIQESLPSTPKSEMVDSPGGQVLESSSPKPSNGPLVSPQVQRQRSSLDPVTRQEISRPMASFHSYEQSPPPRFVSVASSYESSVDNPVTSTEKDKDRLRARKKESQIPKYSLNSPIGPSLLTVQKAAEKSTTIAAENIDRPSGFETPQSNSYSGIGEREVQEKGKRDNQSQDHHAGVVGANRQPDVEVDFYRNPTMLSRQILFQKFGNAIRRLQHHPQEASIWVCAKRKLDSTDSGQGSSNSNKTSCYYSLRQLPLHVACTSLASTLDPKLRGNLELLILRLVKLYPEGCRRVDHEGKLPLHEAILNNACPQTIAMLLMACPKAIDHNDKHGNSPKELNKKRIGDNKKEINDLLKLGVHVWEELRDESNLPLELSPKSSPSTNMNEDKDCFGKISNDAHSSPEPDDPFSKLDAGLMEVENEEITPMAWEQLEKRTILLERMLAEMYEKNYELNQEIEKLEIIKQSIASPHGEETEQNTYPLALATENQHSGEVVMDTSSAGLTMQVSMQNEHNNNGNQTLGNKPSSIRYPRAPVLSRLQYQQQHNLKDTAASRFPVYSVETGRRCMGLPSLEEEYDIVWLKKQLPALQDLEDDVAQAVARARERIREYRRRNHKSQSSGGSVFSGSVFSGMQSWTRDDGDTVSLASVNSRNSRNSRLSVEESVLRAKERIRHHRQTHERELLNQLLGTTT